MAFIYVLYCAFNFDKNVKDNSGWLSILSIVALIVVISVIINKRYPEYDLSFKNNRIKLLRRVQIYLVIPLSIALLEHLQVIPLEIVFRNIATSDKSINSKVIAELFGTLKSECFYLKKFGSIRDASSGGGQEHPLLQP